MRCRIIKRLVSRSEGRHSPVSSEHPKTQAEPLASGVGASSIQEVLDAEGFYVGPPVGVSMWPMLRNRRDAMLVVPAPERLKRHDVALYRRGQMMVLHVYWASTRMATSSAAITASPWSACLSIR